MRDFARIVFPFYFFYSFIVFVNVKGFGDEASLSFAEKKPFLT